MRMVALLVVNKHAAAAGRRRFVIITTRSTGGGGGASGTTPVMLPDSIRWYGRTICCAVYQAPSWGGMGFIPPQDIHAALEGTGS